MIPTIAAVAPAAPFDVDLDFLGQHTRVLVLRDARSGARVAVAPEWQGRVVTSTPGGHGGESFGWINRALVASRERSPHFNALGGEDRLWLGPEGGQYSVYFAPGAPFDLAHWYVPRALDSEPFVVDSQDECSVRLSARFELTNYSGSHFQVALGREVRVLDATAAWQYLGSRADPQLRMVAYESINTLRNAGDAPWRREGGLLSLWILGMFNASPGATIAVPVRPGSEAQLGKVVTSDYFGDVPPDRLRVTESAVFLRGDGQFRSKIGIGPRRSRGVLGSYDAGSHVLTIVQFDQPTGHADYVNSLWRIQDDPYGGDVANSYNDGPSAPTGARLGLFYEMESSSPAVELAPGEGVVHHHRTLHLVGPERSLDAIARAVLGIPLADITTRSGAGGR